MEKTKQVKYKVNEKLRLWKPHEPTKIKGKVTSEVLAEKVLALLFQENELTMYEMKKLLGSPHSTLHKTITSLLKDKTIRIARTEPFRTAEPKKFYRITSRGIGFLMNWSYGREDRIARIDRDFALTTLLRKDEPHPFFKEIRKWKIDQTPNIARILLFGQGSTFFCYGAPGYPEDVIENSVEDIAETLVSFLVVYVFRNELPELNDTEKGWAGFISEYTEMAENPPPEQEIKFLFENNPWLRAKVKNEIESIHHRIEYSYASFAKAYEEHKGDL